MVIAEVAELPVAGLVVQVAQGLLVPLHRDVRGPHHLVPPHCLNPHLILTSASASDHLGAEHQHSEIEISVKIHFEDVLYCRFVDNITFD